MIRYVNSLQTLCCLIRSVFRKGLRDSSVDILDILIGFDAAECKMQVCIYVIHWVFDYQLALTRRIISVNGD